MYLPLQVRRQVARTEEDADVLTRVRASTLSYVKRNHCAGQEIGAYAFSAAGPCLLYASCYATLVRHLFDDLDDLSRAERAQWARYIQRHQHDDGLFRDPRIDCPLAEEADWWGSRHMTLHAIMALACLNAVAQKPFRVVEMFKRPGEMTRWLESRAWGVSAANVSNEVQNYGTMLQYARDFQNEPWAQDALEEMYGWLDKRQDPSTGLWGTRFDSPYHLSQGVQTGYHIWLLYFYDGRFIRYRERIVDSCLATQNRLGGFGVAMNSSACEDIDTLDPLARLYHQLDYRRPDIRRAFEKALPWVLVNQNEDGGWVFRKHQSLEYGHPLTSVGMWQSSMFPTWFRSLSLAFLFQVAANPAHPSFPWRFVDCPGMQFFHPSRRKGPRA